MRRYRLVIADDEKLIRESLSQFIDWEKLGFELVLAAADGEEIIGHMEELRPDAILSDIQMRRTTGLQVAEHVFHNYPDTVVVLLSGYREFEYARQAITFNVREYLLKPISISAIQAAFSRVKEQLDQSVRSKAEKKEIVEKLRIYKQAAVEKLIDLGLMGVLSEKSCQAYLHKFGMGSMSEDVVFYEAWMNTEEFAEYELLAEDILTNIFNMAAEAYGLYHVYIIYGERENEYRIVITAARDGYPLDEGKWMEEMQTNIYEICRCKVSLEMVKRAMPFVPYILTLKGEMGGPAVLGKQVSREKYQTYLQAAASQCLMILNMTEGLDGVIDNIWAIFRQSLREFRLPEQLEHMQYIFQQMFIRIGRMHPETEEMQPFLQPRQESAEEYFYRNIQWMYGLLKKEEENPITVTEQIKHLIREHITESVSLKEAAESVYLSPNYFSRLFREQSGENFSEYSIRMKMEKAGELLKDTQMKVYEISDYLGYKNIKYFYKLFKRIYNCTPTEYRERIYQAAGEEAT